VTEARTNPRAAAAAAAAARRQGVGRPFDALVAMPAALRARVAEVLGVALDGRHAEPAAAAWRLVNADLRGLQARSHRLDRTLLPLRNHNWWEILLATGSRLGMEVYPGLSEREVERLVFDRFARRLTDALEGAEREILEVVVRETPAFSDALDRLALSAEGRLAVLAGLHRTAQAASPATAAGEAASRRTAAFLQAGIVRAGVLPSPSRALRFLRDALPSVVAAWDALAIVRESPPRSARALAVGLAAVHLHGVVAEAVEEVEALRL
jgi:hypothetical protein